MISAEGVRLLDRGLTVAEAREVASWRYPPPFHVHDPDPDELDLLLARDASGEGFSPAVDGSGAVVAFCVRGAEARVPGQAPEPGVLDVGAGVRPDLLGQGVGTAVLEQAVAAARTDPAVRAVRAAVEASNARSLALCARVGLQRVREFPGPGGRPFVELALDLAPPAQS